MVTKLRRAQPDVILHTGYNPDITLFLRQAKEAGLKFQALIGHGAGYSQIDKLTETFGADVNYFFNVDPVAAQLLDPKTLKPGLGDLTAEMVKRYKAETGADEVPPHVSMGFNKTWIFLTDVLPRAIKKYGGFDPEALRKAALDTDIPVGGTIQGYGVKFFPPGTPMAGQNERSLAGGDAVRERRDQGGVADRDQDGRSGVPAAEGARLREVVSHAPARRLRPLEAVRGSAGRERGVLRGGRRRDPRPDRPERIGQEHDLQLHRGPLSRRAPGSIRSRAPRSPASRPTASATRASAARSRSRGRSAI